MSILGEKLKEKLAEKANDITTYVWKGPKVNGVQEEVKLIDASFEQLRKYYEHC
jgi:hypothetical protein